MRFLLRTPTGGFRRFAGMTVDEFTDYVRSLGGGTFHVVASPTQTFDRAIAAIENAEAEGVAVKSTKVPSK